MASYVDQFSDLLQRLFVRPDVVEIEPDLYPNLIAQYVAKQLDVSSDRIKRYKDYADMAADTFISGALDIYADEATVYERVEGASIWPEADNPQVETEIRKMFDNIEVEDNLFGLARYTAQMGDNFVRPLFNQEEGIVGMELVEAEDVDRVVDRYNRLVGFKYSAGTIDSRKVLDPWSFVQFRIIGRTQSVKRGGAIYGTSMLENARRTWRQLTLLEDALVIYRLELGGRHRVFYIDVGNVTTEQALRITRMYKREFGKRQYYDPNSGEWTSRFNPLHLTSDVWWPVRKDSASRIDYLGTDPNVSAIVDIDHFRDKLFAALKIPKAYIGGDEYSSTRYGLNQIDVVFSRFVKRLQRALVNGFTRMAQIHLALRGLDPLQPQNAFNTRMSVISTLDQEQRLQAMDMAISLAAKLKELGGAIDIPDEALSKYIARNILGLTPFDLRMTGQDGETPAPGFANGSGENLDKYFHSGSRNALLSEAMRHIKADPVMRRILAETNDEYKVTPDKGALPGEGMEQLSLYEGDDVVEEDDDDMEVE